MDEGRSHGEPLHLEEFSMGRVQSPGPGAGKGSVTSSVQRNSSIGDGGPAFEFLVRHLAVRRPGCSLRQPGGPTAFTLLCAGQGGNPSSNPGGNAGVRTGLVIQGQNRARGCRVFFPRGPGSFPEKGREDPPVPIRRKQRRAAATRVQTGPSLFNPKLRTHAPWKGPPFASPRIVLRAAERISGWSVRGRRLVAL